MINMDIKLKDNMYLKDLTEFAQKLMNLSKQIGFKVSSRGWCYQLESERLITKAQFDRIETLINRCRKRGILPIDFVAEEEGRQFSGIEKPDEKTPIEDLRWWVDGALHNDDFYTPDWWEGEKYYIQMVVEKIDLKTLFSDVCKQYHIPIATSKGWSSMLQRAKYSQRFAQAELRGQKCVLLYCGDHDPDGLRISDFIRKNLEDLKNIVWSNHHKGYDPKNLEIVRFGLDYDFIEEHHFTWIDNLITGSGKDLANPYHRNHNLEYVQSYIKQYGIRKCEANVLVPVPTLAKELVEDAIKHFLGEDATARFYDKHFKIKKELDEFREKTGLKKALFDALNLIDNSGEF